jgi:transmembrane sensor
MKSQDDNIDERQGPDAQARDWLVRLKSGDATRNDLQALTRWRTASIDHESSYQAALRMWDALGPAMAGQGNVLPAMAPAGLVSRRWVLGGATGLAASAILGVALVGGTSAPAGATVFETGKGERRHVRLATGLDLELNTDTRLYFWPEGRPRLMLDRGEAMISVTYRDGKQLLAQANLVQVTARQARFVLRDDGDITRIACLTGDVSIQSEGRDYMLAQNRSLALGEAEALPVEKPALESETAWQRGLFMFRDRPAGEVVAELNRYRAGHVYLPGDRATVRITGVIHLDRVDLAVDHIARSLGMKVVRLPGGIAFLRS